MASGTSALDPSLEPAELLDWDSAFFARPIARVRGTHLTEACLAALLPWCSARRVECLYFLAAPDDPLTIQLAEANAFHLVDIRLNFERPLAHLPAPPLAICPPSPIPHSPCYGLGIPSPQAHVTGTG